MISNPKQLAAINYFGGPSLIIAGAGTGKTRVITEKIKKIIVEKKIPANQVLALTFTEKAANEMEERVDVALPYGYFDTWIMTFHSFADRVLRQYGAHIGISPTFKILSTVESTLFFRKNLSRFQLNYFYSTGNPTGFISGALTHFSRLRDENIGPEDYLKYAKEKLKTVEEGKGRTEDKAEVQKTLELAQMYQNFEKLKLKNNFLDFADLLFFVYQLLKKRTNVLAYLKEQFRYCLVDEFQDTNIVQYDLLKLLFPAASNPELTVIGDDNQSIYKFRGASVSNILSFQKDYPQTKMFVLNDNYRSFQYILDDSYKLIKNNDPDTLEAKLGISKKLKAARSENTLATQFIFGKNAEQEAEQIGKEILRLVKKEQYRLSEIAILVRANDHAKPVIQALERLSIPFQFLGPSLLYFKNEIRDLIALLKFLDSLDDSVALYRVLTMKIFGLDLKDLTLLNNFAKRIARSLFEALDFYLQLKQGTNQPEVLVAKKYLPVLKEETFNQLTNIYQLLMILLESVPKQSALQLLFNFFEKSGYLKELSQIKTEKDEQRLSNITRFFQKLKKIEGEFGEPTVAEAVSNINLALELGDTPAAEETDFGEENAVNILTVHSAKGLEFRAVFLVSLTADRFPSRFRKEILPIPDELIREELPQGDFHIEEERRLFYVGLTRARDRLYLSAAQYYNTQKIKKKVSPFVVETLNEKKIQQTEKQLAALDQQLSIFDYQQSTPVSSTLETIKHYQVERFSYTQIDTFLKCSLQYKYKFLLKLPEPEAPALSFGSSIHKALELYYQQIKEGKNPELPELIALYKANFIPAGYFDSERRQKDLAKGEKVLTNYYQTFHPLHGRIIDLEKMFFLKIQEGKKYYIINGKIDRIDQKEDHYEIIDYKTGKMPAEAELKKSLQLPIYALAVMDKGYLNLPQAKIVLTYYFVEAGKKFSLAAIDQDLLKTKKQIIETLSAIEESPLVPNKGKHCDWCPFKMICPAWES